MVPQLLSGLVTKVNMVEDKTLKQTPHQRTGRVEVVQGSARQKTRDNVGIIKGPGKPIDRTLFCRHEMKYHINESKAAAIAQYIRPYLQPDRYCKLRRGRAYPIVSLYLDSDNLLLCRQSLRGQKNRFKLRIRSYTDESDYPRFFEIKRRMNTIIIKNRARVMHRDITTLLLGLSIPPQDYSTDEEMLKQFQLYMKSVNARPMILIRYMRQAFEDDSYNRVRATFDRELCYNVTTAPEVLLNSRGWQHHPLCIGGVILEIKFTARYPAWLSRMVEYFDLRQTSISKYATSIKEACSRGFCAPRLSV